MAEGPNETALALVEGLEPGEGGAELVGEGGFTLDPTKAWTKLAHYQLADPDTFLLLFVEAAVLFECEALDIDQREGTTTIRFADLALTPDELHGLLDAPFRGRTSGRLEGLRMLAFGLAAAGGLPGAQVDLRSEDAKGKWSVAWRPGGQLEVERVAARGQVRRVEVAVREPAPLRARLLGELERAHETRRQRLAERARFAPLALRIDQVRCGSEAGHAEFDGETRALTLDRQTIGAFGRAPIHRQSRIEFVGNGVVIDTLVLPDLRAGGLARVEAGDLARDLSHYRLQTNETFERRRDLARAALESLQRTRYYARVDPTGQGPVVIEYEG